MAANIDITGFYKGEVVDIIFLAKNRDGSVLTSPATATVSMTIGRNPKDSPNLTFSTSTSDINLISAVEGSFRIVLDEVDTSTIAEGRTYYYNIWTWQTPTQKTLQVFGKFILQNSVGPT